MQPSGFEVVALRPEADRDVVRAVLAACPPRTVADRFFLPRPLDTDGVLATYGRYLLVGPPTGVTLAGFVDDRPVALATAVLEDGEGTGGSADVAVLVVDAWQRHGIGAALLERALAALHCTTAHVDVQPGNAASMALLRHFARAGSAHLLSMVPGECHFEVRLPR